MQFCNPSDIAVPSDRFRSASVDDKAVVDMADSIKEIGQLHPILVTDDKVLTAGLHRLLACQRLGRKVWYVTESDGKLVLDNPALRRVAEYQENLRRSQFTPEEEARAVADIHRLMIEVYGQRPAGRAGSGHSGWTQQDTAEKLGFRDHSAVSKILTVANAIDVLPQIKEAKTMSEAAKIVRDAVKIEAAKELARRAAEKGGTEIKNPLQFFSDKLILGKAEIKLKELPSNICSMFITDPPWGVSVDDKVTTNGSASQKAQGCYDDSCENATALAEVTIKEMYRVGKPDSWLVMFCGIVYWTWLTQVAREVGYAVYGKPLTWTRVNQDGTVFNAKSPSPTSWPSSATDFMLLARKGSPLLYELNKGDAFLYPIAPPAQRIHQAQKPIGLMKNIISRFHHPGTNPMLIDPFAGSASTLVAAHQLGIRNYLGFELNPEFRSRAIAFMVQSYMDSEKAAAVMSEVDMEDFQ